MLRGRWWASYGAQLQRRPLVAKSLTAAALMALGDGVAQRIERPGNFSFDRLAKLTSISLFLSGPFYAYWYDLLDRRVAGGRGARAVAIKTGLDLLVASPVVIYAFMFAYGMLDRRDQSTSQIARATWEAYPQALGLNTAFWLPANVANFRLVPPAHRVGFSGVVSVAWNACLSWLATRMADSSKA